MLYFNEMMKQGYGIRFTGSPKSKYKLIFQCGNNCASLWRHKKNGTIAYADCSGFDFGYEEHLGPEHTDDGELIIDFSKKIILSYYDCDGYHHCWDIKLFLIDKNGETARCSPNGPILKYLVEEMNMEIELKVEVSDEVEVEEENEDEEEIA